ncbi:MAG: T9SS type A sorting domain-containing protein [Flavobacteriales bacterium]|jgi:hypothetical protein|nr:T9SS type A sorting domain-containing protein [Flavobacteriales bacterium]MCB0756836.1 T9SS type A sorting domain-containing protein [Flavobacteriales bacterium]
MKHLYTVILALAITGSASAQSPHNAHLKQSKSFHPSGAMSQPSHAAIQGETPSWLGNGQRAAFYSEDFSGGGIPAGWTNVDDLTPSGQTNVLFQWSNDPADVTQASANQPLILTFLAPGASNGYLWANSDRGLSAAPPSNHLTRLTTTPIDCSGQPTVLLTMKSTIGVFDLDADTACKVRVSTDGVTWTNFAPFPCLQTGSIAPPCERFSYNPQTVAVDISSVAANQANVYLQFQWRGGWEYYWAIDDLELSPIPENELVMDYGYTSQTGGGYEYGRVPASQMPTELNVGAQVVNFGSADQTNVTVNVSVRDEGGTEIGSASTAVGTMLNGDTVVTDENIVLSNPMATGIYTAHFTMTSDQIAMDENPSNNEKYRYFAVTPDLYSMDAIGVVPDSILTTTPTGTGSFLDNTQDVRLVNYFEINTAEVFYGGEVVLSTANTDVGSYFTMSVYDTADVLASPPDLSSPLTQSDIRVITQTDLDNGGVVGLSFLDPIMLNPGAYFVSANMFQESGNDLYILDDTTVPQPAIASMLWIPIDDQNINLYGGNGTAWAVRLSSQIGVGVQEAPALQGVTMYPSPTTGPVQIRSEITGQMTVEVFNTLGTLVQTTSFNGTATSLDLSGNAAGIYTIRVGDGTNYSVQRVALK